MTNIEEQLVKHINEAYAMELSVVRMLGAPSDLRPERLGFAGRRPPGVGRAALRWARDRPADGALPVQERAPVLSNIS